MILEQPGNNQLYCEVIVKALLKDGTILEVVPAATDKDLLIFKCWYKRSNVVLNGHNGKHIPKQEIDKIIKEVGDKIENFKLSY